MSKFADVTFTGASGRKYVFGGYSIGTEFRDVGGVYIFTKQARNQLNELKYYPLYIGKTESLKDRVNSSHEKWGCAERNGLNCIYVLVETNSVSRRSIEDDLLRQYRTPCNEQYPSNKRRWP